MSRLTLERYQVWAYLIAIGLGLAVGTAWPGSGPVMEMVRVHCTGPGSYSRETLFETWLPPLENAPRSSHFEF